MGVGRIRSAYAASVVATDADGHALTMALGSRPGWMSGVDQGDGSISLAGTPTVAGSFPVVATATDGLATTQRNLSLTVRPRATLALTTSSTSVPEGAGSATLSVQRTGNDTGTVTVAYATTNGTATAGADYAAASGILTWLHGDMATKHIVVPITDDQWTEGSQTFTVTLSAPTGIAMLGTTQTTVTITDNDTNTAPGATIATPTGTVALTDRSHALTVAAILADDGKPAWGGLSATWAQVSGPLGQTAVFADPNSATTSVTFPADGAYALRITVGDGEFTASRDLWVMAGPGDGLGPAGLTGGYWGNKTFTGAPSLERIDAAVDFSWGGAPTGTTLPADGFAVRWTGVVIPEHSQVYTFFTSTDDGTRLWLDGDLVVDKWINQGTTEYSATRACTAGVPVALRMEFFDNSGSAVARLLWSSASVAKAVVPNDRLRSEAGINAAPVIEPIGGLPSGLTVALSASVLDDGRPTASPSALLWTRVSGPGSVAFADPTAAVTTATLGSPGLHRFRLQASDGAATVHREIEIQVVGSGGNLPPVIGNEAAGESPVLVLP